MRKIWLLVAASMLLLLLATGMAQSPATKYIVDPGPVVFENDPNHPAGAPTMVTGSVMLKRSPDGVDSSKATYNLGGGCLVYLAQPVQACSDQSPCSNGYCANTTGGTKACWVQPEPQSCNRHPDPRDPLKENEHLKFLNPTPKYPNGVSERPVFWRVVSCQNLVLGGCANPDPNGKVYRFGQIKRIE